MGRTHALAWLAGLAAIVAGLAGLIAIIATYGQRGADNELAVFCTAVVMAGIWAVTRER